MKVVEFQEMLCMHEETDAVFVINLHTRGLYNLEKVLNVISHFEKSLNSVKVLYQVLKSPRISLLFYFKCHFCTSDTTASHTQ